jgi:hypothetical protein
MSIRLAVYVHGWDQPWYTKLVGTAKGGTATTATERLTRARRYRDAEIVEFQWESGGMFLKAVRKAKHSAGPDLRGFLSGLPVVEGGFDILAFSLGTRAVWEALRSLPDEQLRTIHDVFLFGGALPASRSWWRIATRVQGRIMNFSSRNDEAIRHWYQTRNLGPCRWGRAIGYPERDGPEAGAGIHTRLRNVHNVDATGLIPSHGAYQGMFSKLIDLYESVESRPSPGLGDWRDEFYWEPVPRLPIGGGGESVRGAKAEMVQRALTVAKVDGQPLLEELEIDGQPGPKTVAAVLRFQEDVGVDVDGVVGPATWEALVGMKAEFF